MKEGDLLPTSATALAGGKLSTAAAEAMIFGRGRCKFWALAAISLLAFWSMLASTVTLKWTAGNIKGISEELDSLSQDDLDILELEEREMVVRHMWDVYTHSRRIRFPRFWQEAFEAAYEDLASDEAEVRDSAVTEIARMSMKMVVLEPTPGKAKNSAAEISHVGRDGITKPNSSSSA
ncbi:hypothetical protein KFK09_027563 [Dendrobium nobile]|uniref:Uncharacterized protein n=1 Tax=Dendrobium nobile TaxID=94219 RepID=A0A8T3AA35_DENNO|nr:hypothetical protein KFK09_027563 [Dendrobium nobile]